MLRGGIYFLEEPLIFGAEDSGTEKFAVSYVNYPGERPMGGPLSRSEH
jgi:hypothetical protein